MKPLRCLAGCLFAAILASTARPAPGSSGTEAPFEVTATERLLFLGDSITYGGEYVEYFEAFLRLARPDWHGELLNLGLPSETVSGLSEPGHAGGQFPRPDLHERLDRVLTQTRPTLVIACYGMNDGIYQPFDATRFDRFQTGLRRLREKAAALGARVIHLTPPTFDRRFGQSGMPPGEDYNTVLDRYSEWLLARRADGWRVVDVHGPMNRHLAERRTADPDYRLAGDGVHPNETGHWLLAAPLMTAFGAPPEFARADSAAVLLDRHPEGERYLRWVRERQRLLKDAWLTATGHRRPGMRAGLPLAEAEARAAALETRLRRFGWPFDAVRSAWHGFPRYDFPVAGHTVSVIAPHESRPGRLWAWKGEFLDAFPAPEIALLERGVHIVYLAVPDLLGSPEAVDLWDRCHAVLTGRYAFAAKPALILLSRAGLYGYNWATTHPGRVACIYADGAVCDFKSWPGGRGRGPGSPRDWQLVLDRYGFDSEAEALAYRGNPVDRLEPLARARVPLLHVYGEADAIVPWEENTGILADRYRALGAPIILMGKPGVGHHPHGLPDPTPIVEFILEHLDGQTESSTPASP